MNQYIGNSLQISGVQEMRLVGGKGDGQRIYELSNGCGIDMKVSPDRNGDITQLRYKGINCSYLSPCGYVAPAYYDSIGSNWLQSFTVGYLTTCGLQNVGTPNTDDGEELSLHGSIANQPCIQSWWEEDDKEIRIHTLTSDEAIFGRKFTLRRTIAVSKEKNVFTINDEIENTGGLRQPFEILYHMNMGYPLLDEDSVITIPSVSVRGRDDHAAEDIENWAKMEKPQSDYQERCYYHTFADKNGMAQIYQPKNGVELTITYDASELDGFTEWKMMGVRDYVLGLECGNCYPDGRDVMRKTGMLKFLDPGEKKQYQVTVTLNSR